MKSIEEKAAELLRNLDITKLKEESKNTNILLQQLLQKLMLTYVIDIKDQVLQKQDDLISTYPTELISSLKVISDLYLKMKEENKYLKTKEEKDSYTNNNNLVF
jgi:hypothetical protein